MNALKLMLTAQIMLLLAVLSGCQTTPQSVKDGAVIGGALGAGLGAVAGHQSGRAGEGAAIGAVAGALTGAVVGDAVHTERQINRQRAYGHQQPRPVYANPAPAPVYTNVPPAAGNAYYREEIRVVQGANGEQFEQRVLVKD